MLKKENNSTKNYIPLNIRKLELTKNDTTNQFNEYDISDELPFIYIQDYLYHGIRFQKHLEKLESILKDKKILAGIHQENYSFYSDNCNKGRFVSLLKYTDNHLEYKTFIEENISLLVSPAIDAIITKYISYEEWLYIQTNQINLKNHYSYMHGECFVKDYIDISYIKAIGIPYYELTNQGQKEIANNLIIDINNLMIKYNIKLPLVDTSRYNFPLSKEKTKTKVLK